MFKIKNIKKGDGVILRQRSKVVAFYGLIALIVLVDEINIIKDDTNNIKVSQIEDMQKSNELKNVVENSNTNTGIGDSHKDTTEFREKKFQIIDVIVSYYTYLPTSTGTGDGVTASGTKVSTTSLAIPRKDDFLKYGMEVEFENLATQYMIDYNGKYLKRIADDTGSTKHIRKLNNGVYRLDVFCPKLPNETDEEYHNRVYSYGKTETTAKVYLD